MTKKKTVRYPKLSEMLMMAARTRTYQWIADKCGVSQPAVNDWFNGYDRPRLAHLALIAFYCDLDPDRLAEAVNYNPEDVAKIFEDLTSGKRVFHDLINSFATDSNLIHDILIRSDPRLAVDHAIIRISQLEKVLDYYSSPTYRKPLLEVYSRLLYGQAVASWANSAPSQAIKYLETSVRRQHRIAEEYGDKEPLARAYMTRGFAYWVAGRFDIARFWFSKASTIEIRDDLAWRPETFRNIAISSAYLGDMEGFKRAEYEIRRFLDSEQCMTPLMVARHKEALGRGQALLKLPEALKTIEGGWKNLAKIEAQGGKLVYLRLELMRSQILATLLTKGKDRELIAEVGNNGLSLSEDHGYTKYVVQFKNFLDNLG